MHIEYSVEARGYGIMMAGGSDWIVYAEGKMLRQAVGQPIAEKFPW